MPAHRAKRVGAVVKTGPQRVPPARPQPLNPLLNGRPLAPLLKRAVNDEQHKRVPLLEPNLRHPSVLDPPLRAQKPRLLQTKNVVPFPRVPLQPFQRLPPPLLHLARPPLPQNPKNLHKNVLFRRTFAHRLAICFFAPKIALCPKSPTDIRCYRWANAFANAVRFPSDFPKSPTAAQG